MKFHSKQVRRLSAALAVSAAVLLGCDSKDDKAKSDDAKSAQVEAKTADKPADDVEPKAAKEEPADETAGSAEVAAGGGVDASHLLAHVPDGANFVAVVDFKTFFSSALGEYYKIAMSQVQGEGADAMKAAQACKIGPETWSTAVIAGDTDKNEASIMVFSGIGLGKKDTLECLITKAKEAGSQEEWKLSEAGGKPVVDIGPDKARAFAPSDDTLVIAGKDYIEVVSQRVAGEGKSAVEGSLKEALASTDRSKPIYMAGFPREDMGPGPMSGVKRGSASIDVADGLAIGLRLDFDDPGKAKAASTEIQTQIDQLKPMAAGLVPPPVMESLKVEAKEGTVHASAKATAAELAEIQQKLGQMMGGMGGGGPMGGPPPGGAP